MYQRGGMQSTHQQRRKQNLDRLLLAQINLELPNDALDLLPDRSIPILTQLEYSFRTRPLLRRQ